MATLVCLGFGYSAQHYVAEFGARFDRIVGTTRSEPNATALATAEYGGRSIEPLLFDGETASPELTAALNNADALLISVSPDESGDPALRLLSDTLAPSKLQSIVYLSTVGVYGDHAGAWVDEESDTKPVSARSRERLQAETEWQAFAARTHMPVSILRLAGIYGPGQNALINVARNTARRIDKPGQVFNRIHVADIALVIDACFARRADGVFNVADNEPTAPGDPIVFAAGLLGVAPPPAIPFAEAAKTMRPMALSFYGESKRVRNAKLTRDLGVTLRYPSYREALTALFAAGDGR
ncbi:MAG: family oxidoreductase [Xanthobacteraceae bacterium]|nr:family oxidoreductase [Xanthobacteraceae bacterium]